MKLYIYISNSKFDLISVNVYLKLNIDQVIIDKMIISLIFFPDSNIMKTVYSLDKIIYLLK